MVRGADTRQEESKQKIGERLIGRAALPLLAAPQLGPPGGAHARQPEDQAGRLAQRPLPDRLWPIPAQDCR